MAEITLTKNNFQQEVLKSDAPVLVDFWASWCGPCRMLSPIISDLAEEYEGKIKVGKINVDNEPEMASMFQIMSIPTLIYFQNGKQIGFMVGVHTKEQIIAMLEGRE